MDVMAMGSTKFATRSQSKLNFFSSVTMEMLKRFVERWPTESNQITQYKNIFSNDIIKRLCYGFRLVPVSIVVHLLRIFDCPFGHYSHSHQRLLRLNIILLRIIWSDWKLNCSACWILDTGMDTKISVSFWKIYIQKSSSFKIQNLNNNIILYLIRFLWIKFPSANEDLCTILYLPNIYYNDENHFATYEFRIKEERTLPGIWTYVHNEEYELKECLMFEHFHLWKCIWHAISIFFESGKWKCAQDACNIMLWNKSKFKESILSIWILFCNTFIPKTKSNTVKSLNISFLK